MNEELNGLINLRDHKDSNFKYIFMEFISYQIIFFSNTDNFEL
jgi:hypothetical protein